MSSKTIFSILSMHSLRALRSRLAILPLAALCALALSARAPGEVRNLNVDWKFTKPPSEDRSFPLEVAAKSVVKKGRPFYAVDYDDSGWQRVSVPHPINAGDSFDDLGVDAGEARLYRGFMFYRKHFTIPADAVAAGKKVFVEFESVRQTIYVYVNGRMAGYYEAGVAPAGFDISSFVKPGDNLIAVATDNTAARGSRDLAKETKPGNTPADQSGVSHQWNTKDFNPVQGGLTGNVNLHIKNPVYLTLPLYNNLKTTGAYITASDFDLANGRAKINVRAEVRNESKQPARLALLVKITDAATGAQIASFKSAATAGVAPARDAGAAFMTAHEKDVYAAAPKPTAVITPGVNYISAGSIVSNLNFWSPDNPALYTVEIQLIDTDNADNAGNATAAVLDSQTITTGFREVAFDAQKGLLINGKSFYLKGYAQRSTNEWAVIGVANDWLGDFDAALVRDSGANFIRWMHVAPKPVNIRAGDKHGIVAVCPAGDKESDASETRRWAQRVEAMRDSIIYFRNSPSVIFWEAGNNAISAGHMKEMTALKKQLDPDGGRFMGCRTLTTPEQIAEAEWVGTMIWRHDKRAKASMTELNRHMPIVETEYKRDESPRRVWDRHSPPHYDYLNKWLGKGARKRDGYDVWDLTQEDHCVNLASADDGYAYFHGNRVGGGKNDYYSAAAMMVWSDSNMHARNCASENCRTSGRVDPVRIPKETFYAVQVFQSETPKIKILGHWNYPKLTPETYIYREKEWVGDHWRVTGKTARRDPLNKIVFVLGSEHCAEIELFVNGRSVGKNSTPRDMYVYEFPGIDITQSGVISAIARDAAGNVVAENKIETAGEPAAITLTPVTGPEGLRADGSDVMFFDVEIVDAQGRVCPLADARIDFKLEGPGVFLGGYNSGKFGKDSVIHKNHVFAECGLNRVFVRSTRDTGEITLTATSGKLTARAAARANAIEVKDGFAPPQQTRRAGYKPANVSTGNTAIVARAASKTAAQIQAFKILVNGREVVFPAGLAAHQPDNSTGIVCALRPVLAALVEAKAALAWTYRADGALPARLADFSLPLLTIEAGGRKIEIAAGNTEIVLDSGRDTNLTNYQFIEGTGELIGELPAVLAYIPGVEMKTDADTKTVTITVK